MSLILIPCYFQFGVGNDIQIPGFEVIEKPDEFVTAKRGEEIFIVEVLPEAFRLTPWNGERMTSADSIIIPKP